jgi:hypothetical protein
MCNRDYLVPLELQEAINQETVLHANQKALGLTNSRFNLISKTIIC